MRTSWTSTAVTSGERGRNILTFVNFAANLALQVAAVPSRSFPSHCGHYSGPKSVNIMYKLGEERSQCVKTWILILSERLQGITQTKLWRRIVSATRVSTVSP